MITFSDELSNMITQMLPYSSRTYKVDCFPLECQAYKLWHCCIQPFFKNKCSIVTAKCNMVKNQNQFVSGYVKNDSYSSHAPCYNDTLDHRSVV